MKPCEGELGIIGRKIIFIIQGVKNYGKELRIMIRMGSMGRKV